MIERQCIQENDFTLKVLGNLYYNKQKYLGPLLKYLFQDNEIGRDDIEHAEICYFARIAENAFREYMYRYQEDNWAKFEHRLNEVLNLPVDFKFPRNKKTKKIILASKWHKIHKTGLIQLYPQL